MSMLSSTVPWRPNCSSAAWKAPRLTWCVRATEEWRKRYAIRAGIEGTNSELKRAHGLGRLRVRGGRRVRLAVYLKALACNFKRMVHARLVEMENAAQRASGTVSAVAAA